jgi:predicted metalloendopeptidase
VLREANRERLKTILEAAAASKTGNADTRRIGDFYARCLDTAAIDAAGAKPF